MDNEIWKDIVDYEGIYQVSNLGNVRRMSGFFESKHRTGKIMKVPIKERILKPKNAGAGYHAVCLSLYGNHKYRYIHSLVWIAFNGNYNKEIFNIDHIDENKTNNKLSNLQLLTKRENVSKGWAKFKTTSKYTGVIKVNGVYRASIRIGKKRELLGYFKSEADANNAYQDKLKQIQLKNI